MIFFSGFFSWIFQGCWHSWSHWINQRYIDNDTTYQARVCMRCHKVKTRALWQ